MIKYIGHNPEGTFDITDVIDWVGRTESDDGQRKLFVPTHPNPLTDWYATPDGNLITDHYAKRLVKDLSPGLPVITSPFAGKFFSSNLVETLKNNRDTLMIDQFGNPHVPSNLGGEGDTYFVVDSYPGGPKSQFLQIVERVNRQMAQETLRVLTEMPEWKPLLIGSVVAGEMKYPHKDYYKDKPRWYDYSHYAIEAYQWYTSQYIGAGKRWENFGEFKKAMEIHSTQIKSIGSLRPPKNTEAGAQDWNRLPSQENSTMSIHFRWWQGYRIWALKTHIQDTVRWWKEEGMTDIIYWGSQAMQQTTGWRRQWSLMDPRLVNVPGVVPGVSLYQSACSNTQLLNIAKSALKDHPGYGWNSFQWNPANTVDGIAANLDVLRLQFQYGAQVINVHPAMPINPDMLSNGDCAVRRWMTSG